MKIVTAALSLTGALALAACNQTATAPASTGVMASSSGTGCNAEIARYRAVMSNDLATGNVNQSVYNRVDRDIAQAEAACAGGRDAEAVRMVNTTKARHGYL
jgi:hypothetical protein